MAKKNEQRFYSLEIEGKELNGNYVCMAGTCWTLKRVLLLRLQSLKKIIAECIQDLRPLPRYMHSMLTKDACMNLPLDVSRVACRIARGCEQGVNRNKALRYL